MPAVLWPRSTDASHVPAEPFCLASYPSAFHSVMFNPVEPRLIATANSKEGVGLWDIRKPRRFETLTPSLPFPPPRLHVSHFLSSLPVLFHNRSLRLRRRRPVFWLPFFLSTRWHCCLSVTLGAADMTSKREFQFF